MIFTGISHKTPFVQHVYNVQIFIYIYVYIVFISYNISIWEDEGVCSYHFGRCFVTTNIDFGKLSALESVMKFALSEPHWLIDPYCHRRQTLEVLNIWESWKFS